MKMLLTSLTVLMALLCAVTMRSAGAKNNAKVTRESKLEAEQLWELAIAAKGGRERLYAVRNLLVSSGYRYKSKSQRREVKTRFEDFYVFPDKAWRWSDERPAIWGVKVEMINHERGFEYITYPNDPTSPRRLKIGLPEDNPNIDAQLFYLMETRWQRPQPISAESGKLNGKPVDIVHTAVNERKVDFVLDRQTHLLMEVVDYSPTGKRYSDTATDFSNYAEVSGIQMPQKELYFKKIHLEVSYQINVDYDERLFERPPTIEAGPEAWRKRSNRR